MKSVSEAQCVWPKELSEGEETFALHLRANGIDFDREVCLIPGRKWRVDFLIKPSLVIEVEGGSWQMGRHQRATGFTEDCAKYNALTLAGYSVLRFTTAMVLSGKAIDTILPLLGREKSNEANSIDTRTIHICRR